MCLIAKKIATCCGGLTRFGGNASARATAAPEQEPVRLEVETRVSGTLEVAARAEAFEAAAVEIVADLFTGF
jgi:hypothetical protein